MVNHQYLGGYFLLFQASYAFPRLMAGLIKGNQGFMSPSEGRLFLGGGWGYVDYKIHRDFPETTAESGIFWK